jgi:hypothetical protein
MSSIVLVIPGCPCTGSSWCCWMMASCYSSGTSLLIRISKLSVLAGPNDPSSLTLSIAVSITSLVPAISCLRLRASALPLSFPGVYTILNLYCPNSSDYRVCRGLSTLVVVNRVRFLWSENIVSSEQLSAYTLQCFRQATIASSSLSWTS